MDPFALFIEESVLYAKNDYYKMMFKTKDLFFKDLIERKSAGEFKEELAKIWSQVDHSYMEQQIKELEDMVSAKNIAGHKIINENVEFKEIYKLEPISRYKEVEERYASIVEKYYEGRLKTLNTGNVDEQVYISNLVEKYDKTQATIPYFNKDGTIRAYHNIASYNSMVYNSNLNRAGWNRTMYDSQLLGNDLMYLAAHPFACPLCMSWQGKVYSSSGKSKEYPPKDLAIDGGVGHPNCKHQWTIYWDDDQLQKDIYDSSQWEENYINKQKIQAAELERTKIKNDRKIYESLGNYDEVDKATMKIRSLNSKIKELK